MKSRNLILSLLLVLPLHAFGADENRAGVDIETTTTLKEAVRQFNAQVEKLSTIGRDQPPLTVDEVVASIWAWDVEKTPIDADLLAVFQQIAKRKIMPKGSSLDFTTGWQRADGAKFTVWWINICVSAPNPAKEDSQIGYGYRVRARTIAAEMPAVIASEKPAIQEMQHRIADHFRAIGFLPQD